MIRRASRSSKLEMSETDPTPEQIRQRSEAIRKHWTPRERARRSSFKHVSWMPPLFSESELPGHLTGDFDR